MSYRVVIFDNIKKVAIEQNCSLAPLSDDLALEATGLDSLCWAIIMARLESCLGFDPFTSDGDVYFPVTLGDFIKAYEHAAK